MYQPSIAMNVNIDPKKTDELNKANLVISQFITSCSHSMRGPLKSIAGLVNLLQHYKNINDDDGQLFIGLISNTVTKMEGMLDELEYFLENSKRDVVLNPVSCHEIVDKVLAKFKDETSTGNIQVQAQITESVPLHTDGSRFKVILTQLLANAINFKDTKKDKNAINIRVETTLTHYTIAVEDNGIGIEPENKSKIFDLFYRANEQSAGFGIGLYVVREVIEKMKGKIEIESRAGQGTTFMVTLPNFATNKLRHKPIAAADQ